MLAGLKNAPLEKDFDALVARSLDSVLARSPYFQAVIGSITLTATTGTAPAYIVQASPLVTSYVNGLRLALRFHAAGTTGSNTLNVNALGAKSIKQYDSAGIKQNAYVPNGLTTDVVYDGIDFILIDAAPPAGFGFFVVDKPTTNQTIPTSGAPTIIQFTGTPTVYDASVTWNGSTTATVQRAGRWRYTAVVSSLVVDAPASAIRVDVYRNGSPFGMIRGTTCSNTGVAGGSAVGQQFGSFCQGTVVCAIGDTFDARIFQNSGTSASLQAAGSPPSSNPINTILQLEYMGPV